MSKISPIRSSCCRRVFFGKGREANFVPFFAGERLLSEEVFSLLGTLRMEKEEEDEKPLSNERRKNYMGKKTGFTLSLFQLPAFRRYKINDGLSTRARIFFCPPGRKTNQPNVKRQFYDRACHTSADFPTFFAFFAPGGPLSLLFLSLHLSHVLFLLLLWWSTSYRAAKKSFYFPLSHPRSIHFVKEREERKTQRNVRN